MYPIRPGIARPSIHVLKFRNKVVSSKGILLDIGRIKFINFSSISILTTSFKKHSLASIASCIFQWFTKYHFFGMNTNKKREVRETPLEPLGTASAIKQVRRLSVGKGLKRNENASNMWNLNIWSAKLTSETIRTFQHYWILIERFLDPRSISFRMYYSFFPYYGTFHHFRKNV